MCIIDLKIGMAKVQHAPCMGESDRGMGMARIQHAPWVKLKVTMTVSR